MEKLWAGEYPALFFLWRFAPVVASFKSPNRGEGVVKSAEIVGCVIGVRGPYEGRKIIHLAMVHKKRGNPNWGKMLPSPAAVATEFEGMALRLGLTKETYSSSVSCESGVSATVIAAMCRNGC